MDVVYIDIPPPTIPVALRFKYVFTGLQLIYQIA